MRKKNIGIEHRPLPGCLLTKKEWDTIIRRLEAKWDDPRAWKIVQPIIANAARKRYPNQNVCMVCGSLNATPRTGMCRSCYRRLHDYGELRSVGHARGFVFGNDGKCEACGREKIESSGLCRNCYYIKKLKGLKTNAEVRKYKLQQHSRVTPVLDITKEEAILYGYTHIKENSVSDSDGFNGDSETIAKKRE